MNSFQAGVVSVTQHPWGRTPFFAMRGEVTESIQSKSKLLGDLT